MWRALRRKDVKVRILLGFVVGLIAVGMLLYLVPGQGGSTVSSADVVAEVGDQQITVLEVRQQMQRISRRGNLPPALEAIYAQQIVKQLVFERVLELEAGRLGIRVSDEERAQRIRQLLPTTFAGDTFVGMERYAADVQLRFDLSVPEFEDLVRRGLLEEKFRRLVTSAISVTPEEVDLEFRRRNEKIKIDYVVVKPGDLEAKVEVTDADLASHFEKNKARYKIPERRVIRYALLDFNQLRQRVTVSEEELRAHYNEQIERYRIPNRVRASHVLFKTIGKTDAEVEETRKKAEDVLKKAKKGAKFEELAKQYSEDTTKTKGGDLGWIIQGQTVPEFEKAAFGLPPGSISELVKTQYGFHIIKIVSHETARLKTLDEVRDSILPGLTTEKAERLANEQTDKISAAIRQSGRRPLDEIAVQFHLTIGETRPVAANDTVIELGSSQELRDAAFRLRLGDLSYPIRTDRGFIVATVKEIQPAHAAALDEVRDKVAAEFRKAKAGELAKARAEELVKRSQSGEKLDTAAKATGFEMTTSQPFARTGSVPGAGSARQLSAAFGLGVGQTGPPAAVGQNWVVYRVKEREEAKPEELEKQRKEIERQVLQTKQAQAYEAFRSALEARLKQEGKVKINSANIKRLGGPA